MTAPALSHRELIKLIRESGIISSAQLDQSLKACHSTDVNLILNQLLKDGLITEYQGKELYAGRNKGFFIGKYKVLRPLATGGMGVVLHCEHVHMHHQVALKLLPKDLNDNHAAVTRFYREARAVAAVKHPNVVQAYDVGQEGEWHCLVMEYVEGINLHKLITTYGAFSEVRAAHYIAQAAQGLQCIMQSGLVHRDLKPGNLLLTPDNCIKVLDLGLARFLDQRSDDLTRQMDSDQVLGTADFISPEQALHSHQVDIRADIYSLGMSFYFLLAGKFPFNKEKTVAGKLMAHQRRMPKPLLKRRPDVTPELDAIILKMIQKKPEDRYATPQEVVEVLKPWTNIPLPLPEPEWFTPASTTFPALPFTPRLSATESTREIPALQTSQSTPALEPATVKTRKNTPIQHDPLAELQDVVTYSLSKASRETASAPIATPQQIRLGLMFAAFALPILTLLLVVIWYVFLR